MNVPDTLDSSDEVINQNQNHATETSGVFLNQNWYRENLI